MKQKNVIYFRKSTETDKLTDFSKHAQDKLLTGVLNVVKQYHKEILIMRTRKGIQAKNETDKSKLK